MDSEEKLIKSEVADSLVFISHDTRDAKLAEAFSALLRNVSAGVLKSFRTSDKIGNQGIDYGVEWYPEIIKNIQKASDVVCLLTKRSVDRPWILFEAGMAKGKLETPILGVALGIPLKEASSGPFAQFQNCGDDEESLTKLVFQLVDRIPNSEPDKDTIKYQVGKFKEKIAEILLSHNAAQGNDLQESPSQDNSSAKLFEEIKVMFQDLPSRIENNISPKYRGRKKRRFHPMMIQEMIHTSGNNRAGIFVSLGLMREGMPWIYDIGIETVRTIDSRKSEEEMKQAFLEFREVVTLSTRNFMMEELMDSKEDYMIYEEFPNIILRAMEKYMETKIKYLMLS